MSEVLVRLGHHAVAIELPTHLLSDGILNGLCGDAPAAGGHERIVVSTMSDGSYAIAADDGTRETGLKRGAVLERLLARLATRFTERAGLPMLKSAAVSWGDSAVLLAGPEACGKSSLAAWFIEKGFALIADDQVAVVDAAGALCGYRAPLTFAADGADHLVALSDFASAPMARTARRIHVGVKDAWRAEGNAFPCGMMIFPRHAPDARPRVEKLEAAAAARLLKAQLTSPVARNDATHFWNIEMARSIPAIALTYSHYDQIDGLLDRLVKLVIEEKLSPDAFDRFVSGIGRPSGPAHKYPVPERSTRQFSRFMTIGMATYDDYDGVYFSLQAIRFYHPEILDEVEFLIIDNHPDGPCAAPLKALENHIPNLRYIPVADVTGTAVRDRVFSEATSDFVLCMDCHVLFAAGSLRKLIDYFRAVPSSIDLIQGPLVFDDLGTISTHWAEGWAEGMFGKWAKDPAGGEADGEPFAITFHGLGVFACRRDAWPGFNPSFRGFGGEEGYIHERFRRRGGQVLCLPSLRWLHRFGRPMGTRYPNRWQDRIRNYLIAFGEVGWDTADMQAHFREKLGRRKADRMFAAVGKELAAEAANGVKGGAVSGRGPRENFEDDEPYDLGTARLSFVAEVSVPILIENFSCATVACVGRGCDLWAGVFARHDIAVQQPDTPDQSCDIICSFEGAGISSQALAEHYVLKLTRRAPVVVIALQRSPAESAIDHNRLRASWTALFARRGYRLFDCLRPALARDPRIDPHYQQNLMVFTRTAATTARAAPAIPAQATDTGVSVILPVYNGAAFLGQAIESILLQTHRAFELIVVNDGSTDTTGAIAESYARVDKRVRVIHQENGGEPTAFNAGSAEARFALLARLDHDDVALPERLAMQVAFMQKNEDIAVISGTLRYIDREGRLTGVRSTYPLTPEACHAGLIDTTAGPIANPAAMMRKAAFDRCGGLRVQFKAASDFDLWLRMDEHFKLANLPDPLVDYRLHGANFTTKRRFFQALEAHIALQSARLRRSGQPDPVDGWTKLEFDHLSVFPMPQASRERAYRELFDAALKNFEATSDPAYLKLADECLSLIPTGSLPEAESLQKPE